MAIIDDVRIKQDFHPDGYTFEVLSEEEELKEASPLINSAEFRKNYVVGTYKCTIGNLGETSVLKEEKKLKEENPCNYITWKKMDVNKGSNAYLSPVGNISIDLTSDKEIAEIHKRAANVTPMDRDSP